MRKFNFIYNKIVEGEKDLAGIIAYSVYKKHKIEIIEQIKEDKNDDKILESELQAFVSMSNTDTQIESYRNEAKLFLKEYSDILLKEKLEDIENYYKKKAVGNFMRGVWQSVVGSIFFSLLIGLLIIILWSTKVGFKEVVENIFNIEIIDEKSSNQSIKELEEKKNENGSEY